MTACVLTEVASSQWFITVEKKLKHVLTKVFFIFCNFPIIPSQPASGKF